MLSLTRLGTSLALTTAISMLTAGPTLAQSALSETRPGWSNWMPTNSEQGVDFATGFSNGDALNYSSWAIGCTEQAESLGTEDVPWHRVTDSVEAIGIGTAELGCVINDELYSSTTFMAVRSGNNYEACLRVNADSGNGLNLRDGAGIENRRIRTLTNGTTVTVASLPYSLSTDDTGRQWIRIDSPESGWVSVTPQLGEPFNLLRCD